LSTLRVGTSVISLRLTYRRKITDYKQTKMPTELRLDLNVGVRFLNLYIVSFLRRTQSDLMSILISNIASFKKLTMTKSFKVQLL
jgi:hypothetical protein